MNILTKQKQVKLQQKGKKKKEKKNREGQACQIQQRGEKPINQVETQTISVNV